MPLRLTRLVVVGFVALSAALAFVPVSGATTMNIKVPVEGLEVGNLCNGDVVELQGFLHLIQQGEFEENAPRQHVIANLNGQQLTGVGVPSGQLYSVTFVANNITNSRVGSTDVFTATTMINVVSRGSGENFQIQTVLHMTTNANGETTADFQNFHVSDCDV